MILITNDDGFHAKGIQALWEGLSQEASTLIVAPENEQSAVGHAITLHKPLRVREVNKEGKLVGYAVNGTPADCVKLAITELMDAPPELVISGVNQGGNLGSCAIYSGTVSAATEAVMMGVPGIAVSLNSWESQDFSAAVSFIKNFYPKVMESGLPKGVALNINVPAVSKGHIRGAVITRQGESRVIETFDKRTDPRNQTYYWLSGEMRMEETEVDTDCERIKDNYISITPIHNDLTCYKVLGQLKKWDLPSV